MSAALVLVKKHFSFFFVTMISRCQTMSDIEDNKNCLEEHIEKWKVLLSQAHGACRPGELEVELEKAFHELVQGKVCGVVGAEVGEFLAPKSGVHNVRRAPLLHAHKVAGDAHGLRQKLEVGEEIDGDLRAY